MAEEQSSFDPILAGGEGEEPGSSFSRSNPLSGETRISKRGLVVKDEPDGGGVELIESDVNDPKLEKLVSSLVAKEVKRATARLVADNKKIRKELAEKEARLYRLENPARQLALRVARRWRGLFLLGGLVAPAMGVKAILAKSERWAWMSLSFYFFSVVCSFVAAGGNVRNCGNRSEKALIIISGLGPGASVFLPGYALAGFEDEETAIRGMACMYLGVFCLIIFPPCFYFGVPMWGALDDLKLGVAFTNAFKSTFYTLGSITYISTAVVRSILAADDDSPIGEQCGNPIIPSVMVNGFLAMIWAMQFVLAPLMKETTTKTWKDVMLLKMDKMEGLHFGLLGVVGALAGLQFANTNEDGEFLTSFMTGLAGLFVIFFLALILVLAYDVVVKPFIFPSSASTTTSPDAEDGNSSSPSNNTANTIHAADAFDMREVAGASLGGGL
mmetsp:Transcript_5204/g.9977  ORF Transcript_5204/g.9977 Transcript_5204/m.9977 type:complete len:443 (-) Transcript_5204:50-1378(-)|eukprot:CAMPEP_0182470692 /NCGR_PEP_ID=MMETSP1319-20130603/19090_1 /TAXON_ID=172717 /ORGANISM="Bolidomonas pacifica, Strain RCC208" /LENGTH=442 /DNA_ID=CAMNT_0024671163 /DNA_START=117 /DNA_END=1445 /DNA_ORIENTATION=+